MSDTNTAIAERPPRQIDTVRQALERLKPQLALALPKHLTPDRLLRVAMTAVQNTPKLLECDRTSLYSAIFTCAQLGLEPDGVLGQAYLVPFKGKVQFIPGYKGLLALARNSGEVSSIAAHEVRENDRFEFDFGSGDPPQHTFDLRSERGEIIAVYAIVKFKDGATHWDMMTRAEIDTIRNGSQGWQSAVRFGKQADTPWGAHYAEMAKKSAIRRIAKYLPLSVQKAAALADAYDSGRTVTLDGHGDVVIDDNTIVPTALTSAAEQRVTQLEQFEERHGEAAVRDYDPDTGEVMEAAAAAERSDPVWRAEVAALEPKESTDKPGETDWKTYAEAIVWWIGKAGKADLAALEVSRHPYLRRLREEDVDLYQRVTAAIAARAKALAAG